MNLREQLRTLPTANACYGIAEYISLPALMLFAAPFLLHHLGTEQYAIWILSSAAVTGGTLLSTGFGDAAIKYLSAARGQGDHSGAERIIRNLLTLNLGFAGVFSILLWSASGFLVSHLPQLSGPLQVSYRRSLALGAILLVIKSVESVFICAQRAYERYTAATLIAIAARAATIISAVLLAITAHGVVTIVASTLAVGSLSLIAQAAAAWRYLALTQLMPACNRKSMSELFSFGCFSWLQGLVALFSSQADRLLVGYMLGTTAVSYYSICIQIALPIHGIAASGLQALFPYLGARLTSRNLAEWRQSFISAFLANTLLVAALLIPIAFGSHFILRHWMGAEFAEKAASTLTITAFGFALLGLNVTGHFILMALGRVRLLATLNLVGAVAMLTTVSLLAPRYGIAGAACGRLIYGPITWLAYPSLRKSASTTSAMWRPCEDS